MGFAANYLWNLARVSAGREATRPLFFFWRITYRCALGCRYCREGAGLRLEEEQAGAELDTADAKRLLGVLRGATDSVHLAGGEPMVRADLEEVLAHARAHGFRTALSTKGIGLPERPDLAHLCDVIFLGLDSLDAGRLAGLLGCPAQTAQCVLRALDWALSKRAAHTKLVLATVATPSNLNDVAELLGFAERYRLAFLLSPETLGPRIHPELLGNPEYRALVDLAIRARSRGVEVLGAEAYLRGIRDGAGFRCHPLLTPTVQPDGRLSLPCPDPEQPRTNLLSAGSCRRALDELRRAARSRPACGGLCHGFRPMAVSVAQRSPLTALSELWSWH